MKNQFIILISILVISSCIQDETSSIEDISNQDPYRYAKMDLNDLKIGDEFYFGRRDYGSVTSMDSIHFSGDTMILKVMNLQNDTITWNAEFRVQPGLSHMVNGSLVPVQDTTIELTWSILNNRITNLSEIEPRAHIVASDPLLVNELPFEFSRQIQFEFNNGNISQIPGGPAATDDTGFILGGTEYHFFHDTMNVNIYCYCPSNGIGTTIYHVYGLNHGLISSHSVFNRYGWTRIKQFH